MTRRNISSGSSLEASIGFSRAVRIGEFISVSGTAPISEDGGTSNVNDVYGQTVRCLEIMKNAIEEAGGSLDNVIRIRIMLIDISRWKEAAKAHGECFASIKPACTFVEVKGFIKEDWLVETEADCVIE
jgi:enamine deaminase RidA (YjgF/YER057c/UK114 family)